MSRWLSKLQARLFSKFSSERSPIVLLWISAIFWTNFPTKMVAPDESAILITETETSVCLMIFNKIELSVTHIFCQEVSFFYDRVISVIFLGLQHFRNFRNFFAILSFSAFHFYF